MGYSSFTWRSFQWELSLAITESVCHLVFLIGRVQNSTRFQSEEQVVVLMHIVPVYSTLGPFVLLNFSSTDFVTCSPEVSKALGHVLLHSFRSWDENFGCPQKVSAEVVPPANPHKVDEGIVVMQKSPRGSTMIRKKQHIVIPWCFSFLVKKWPPCHILVLKPTHGFESHLPWTPFYPHIRECTH